MPAFDQHVNRSHVVFPPFGIFNEQREAEKKLEHRDKSKQGVPKPLVHHPAADPHFRFKTHQNFRNLSNNRILSEKFRNIKMVLTRSQARKVPVRHLRLVTPKRSRKNPIAAKSKRKR